MTRLSVLSLGLACAATVTKATPLLLDRQDATTQTEADCTSDKEITPMCWETLKVADYITAWVEANGTAAGCDTLGFTQCFLEAHGHTGLTCDDITSNTCPPFDTIDPSIYSSPQEFYVLWNIYNIYNIYNSWSQSLYNGAQLAAGTLDDIVATISPPTNAEVTHSVIASLLASSFFYLANFMAIIPQAAPLAVIETFAAGLFVNNAATSFSMTSTLMGYFSQGADTDTRFTTLGTIGTDLTDLVVEFQQQLATGIKEVQGNHTIFLAMANQGAMSLRMKTGTVEQSINLFQDMQVFLISEALAANGIIATKSTGVNAVTFAGQAPGTVDCSTLNAAGTCWNYWVDEAAGNTYAFHNPNDWGADFVPMMVKIENEGWANMSDLLRIEDCQGVAPALNTTDLRMTCLASHKQCEWNYPADDGDGLYYYALGSATPQWTNCDNDGHWGYACSSWTTGRQIPDAYIGPAKMYTEEQNVWCKYFD